MADFAGAVLTGGRSARMGRDKALLEVDGTAMAVRVARALRDAGAERVLCVGGDLDALRALGLDGVADPRQGDGPLAGIAAALGALHDHDAVAIVACDLPDIDGRGIRLVHDALGDADVAMPPGQPLHAVWRPRAIDAVEATLAAGERAVNAALDRLRVVEVDGVDPRWVRNVNTPRDLTDHG